VVTPETPTMSEHSSDNLLEVRDLTISYCDRAGVDTPALRNVSFEIHRGEALGLLGESGSGKTTLAMSLLGLLPAKITKTNGAICLQGRELQGLPEAQWQKIRGAEIAMIPQNPALALSPIRRVGDQVADVVEAHQRWKRRECREEAEALLHLVHLQGAANISARYPFELSGGQLQRVAIAQALAGHPSLIIADEPTSALDTILREEIVSLLEEIRSQQDVAFLLISHEPEVLARFASRILVMHEGRIVDEGSFGQLCRHAADPFTRSLLAAMRVPAGPNGVSAEFRDVSEERAVLSPLGGFRR
jgi:peptide/nickel transport system ATP-binding protein